MYPLRATSKECPRSQTRRRCSFLRGRRQARTGQTSTSVVKFPAKFDVYLSRIVKMKSSKGQAVVE